MPKSKEGDHLHLREQKQMGAWCWQGLILAGVILVLTLMGLNIVRNSQQLGLDFSFGFLVTGNRPASFDIGDSPIPFGARDPLWKALMVGVLNSLRVTIAGIILATILGILLALTRLTSHWLLEKLVRFWIDIFRNTPLLLQLFFWYFAVFLQLPKATSPLTWGSFLSLSNQGLKISLGAIQFSFSPEFATLLTGLTVYTAAFIAEVVRGGIQSVEQGQWEAGRALGLKESQLLRRVVFPQALRVIIPSLTSEYLNLAKNSSLGIAIGYSDIYAVSSTVANQTGKALVMLVIVMAVYLALNLVIASGMNYLYRKVIGWTL